MKAARVHRFGGPEVIIVEDMPVPVPAVGELVVKVAAAGVGPWDGWIRSGKSVLPQPLPLTLGSDIAGIVAAVGSGVEGFAIGDEVYGVTNARFTNACAEYAAATASMIAHKPRSLDFAAAASVPVIAVTAWQMLHDHGGLKAGQTVLIHGGAGNVGAYAVQLARAHGARVLATGRPAQVDELTRLGADVAILDGKIGEPVDLVIDTIGPAVHAASFEALRPGGLLVSAVAEPDAAEAARRGVRAKFMLVAVGTAVLNKLGEFLDAGKLATHVGEVMPLESIKAAHEMLEGMRPRPGGKLVLTTIEAATKRGGQIGQKDTR